MELLVYMGILPMLLITLASVFGTIVDTQLESEASSSIDKDGKYIMAKLAYDFKSANAADTANYGIVSPSASSSGQVLKLKLNSFIYTYEASNSGSLQLTSPNLYDLTGSDSSISALMFRRLGPGNNTDTISMSFRLSSKIHRKGTQDYKDFQTTFSMQ